MHAASSQVQVGKQASLAVLERELSKLPQVSCPVTHHFAPGMYAREINIPAGTTIIGAVHRTDNLVVLSKGTLRMLLDGEATEIEAPFVFTCRAGAKNAVLALTDVTWTNFFPTTETDVDKLVPLLTDATVSELLGGERNAQRLFALAQQGQLEN